MAVLLVVLATLTALPASAATPPNPEPRALTEIRNLISPRMAQRTPRAVMTAEIQGQLAGTWDYVDGWIAFPYSFPDVNSGAPLYLLARGFPASALGGDQYGINGWDGQVFWADLGDGVPHLLSAQLIDPAFVPAPGNVLTHSGRLYVAQYALYKQNNSGIDYTLYPDKAASADLVFVTDANDTVIDEAVDVYDATGTYQETRALQAGDQIQFSIQAADLNAPDSVWLIGAMDLQTLNGAPQITKAYRLPNVDFTDQYLATNAAQLDASALPLYLLLVGSNSTTTPAWGYSQQPVDLGYTWGVAKSKFNLTDGSASSSSSSGGGALGGGFLAGLLGLGLWGRRRHRR